MPPWPRGEARLFPDASVPQAQPKHTGTPGGAAPAKMMLFWLRFFGYRRSARLGRGYHEDVGAASYKPRKSIMYDPETLYCDDGLAPLEDGIAAARRQSHRRPAIDLERGTRSLDLGPGPGVRMSVDSLSSRQSYMATPMSSYMNFYTIHRGRHAKIVRATQKYTGARVALKVFDKSNLTAGQREDIVKEVQILRLLKGDGIVDFDKKLEDDCTVTVALKECTGGTLMNRLAMSGGRMVEEACVRHVVKPLVAALAMLHSKKIVHRDLKPEHLLYDEHSRLHLVDFHSAAIIGKIPLTGREGTMAYMAPEVLTKPTPDEIFHDVLSNGISDSDLPSYDEKVDIWSMGVIIVEALTGRQPFVADTAEAMLRAQQQELQGSRFGGVLDLVRDQEFLSLEGQDFLSSIFRLNPGERPSAASLLSHPWLELLGSDDGDYQMA
ncbi:unnamed protein product [Ostreobium quekettii]|uniref:Protein kinase domain-containing protein n=1 Tax=Ostreobium quekettii TaxID=121088 RepID=A0A8S1IKK8_9CHLO|nr:unnamed protein product [Ostreobium quekettii]